MPLKLASTLVQFLTEPDDLVVDPFGGWMTTALAAENNGRRWIATERMAEYAFGAEMRFSDLTQYPRASQSH
jgi:site-specific DNA-methyltransferase (cytosine-N4-specific)